jgi:Arc/MetJ family transcription regulator
MPLMRLQTVIDARLMKRAMRASGATTKREAVEKGLKLLVQMKVQERIRTLRGKVRWEGNLDVMRRHR